MAPLVFSDLIPPVADNGDLEHRKEIALARGKLERIRFLFLKAQPPIYLGIDRPDFVGRRLFLERNFQRRAIAAPELATRDVERERRQPGRSIQAKVNHISLASLDRRAKTASTPSRGQRRHPAR